MALNNPLLKYQEHVENTATPAMTTALLFEEAAKNINFAIKAIKERNIQDSHNAILKAENIYIALSGFLNPEFEISQNLAKLYDYAVRRLVEANSKKDAAILKEVLGYTIEFRDTWRQAEKNANIEIVKPHAERNRA